MAKIALDRIVKFNNGLNVLSNAGVALKDVELSFSISVFKAESEKLVEAFQEVSKEVKGTDEEQQEQLQKLLQKEYEIELPVISLSVLKDTTKEIPLIAFDFLHEFIKK